MQKQLASLLNAPALFRTDDNRRDLLTKFTLLIKKEFIFAEGRFQIM